MKPTKRSKLTSPYEPKAKVDLITGIYPGQICSTITLLLQDLTVVQVRELAYAQVMRQDGGAQRIRQSKRRLLRNHKIY